MLFLNLQIFGDNAEIVGIGISKVQFLTFFGAEFSTPPDEQGPLLYPSLFDS